MCMCGGDVSVNTNKSKPLSFCPSPPPVSPLVVQLQSNIPTLHYPHNHNHLSARPCFSWGSMAATRVMRVFTKASCSGKGTAAKGGTWRKRQAVCFMCVCVCVCVCV
jgi:hypothetical protein